MEINRKKIVYNTFFLYGKTLITMIISFLSTRLILEGLGVTDYGIYGTVGGAILMFESLNLAMSQATQRFICYAEGKAEKEYLLSVFNNSIILHLGIGVVILMIMYSLFFPLFDHVFNIPVERIEAAKYCYLLMTMSAFVSIITVPYDAMINAHEDFLFYCIAAIVIALLKLGAALSVFYCLCDKLVLYTFLLVTINIVNMIFIRLFCRIKYNEYRFKPSLYFNVNIIRNVGGFAIWNFIGTFANLVGNHCSTILMNHFFGPILIAAKNIGDQICTQVAVLTNNMTKALNPAIIKSESSGNRYSMINLSYNSCRFSFLLYLLLAVPFIFNTEPLLLIWLKDVPKFAVLFCQLQVIRTLFEQFFIPLRMSLMAQGSIKQVNLVDFILAVVTFFILLLLYHIGFEAQWHYYISIIFMVFISGFTKIYFCKTICNMRFKDYIRIVIIPCSIVMVLSILSAYIIQTMMSSINVIVIVFSQIFVILVLGVLFGFTKNERKLVFSKLSIIKR